MKIPKHKHRDHMVEIGIQAIEHSLRFLPQDNNTRLFVEHELANLRKHNSNVNLLMPETVYTQESCIRRALNELIKLSVSEKWISGNMLSGPVFVPCWDTGSFVSREDMQAEAQWQNDNLYPQIERVFRDARESKDKI